MLLSKWAARRYARYGEKSNSRRKNDVGSAIWKSNATCAKNNARIPEPDAVGNTLLPWWRGEQTREKAQGKRHKKSRGFAAPLSPKKQRPAPKGEPSAKRKQNGRKATKKPVPSKGGWCGSARWNADEGGARVCLVGGRPCAANGLGLVPAD